MNTESKSGDPPNQQIGPSSGKSAAITIAVDGTIHLQAYCLKTDSWDDYLAFKREAAAAEASADYANTRRYLRAALTCLFSHFEGVVNEVLRRNKVEEFYPGDRLCDRGRNVGREASKGVKVPHLNFRLEKHLRDIIAHPGIEIAFGDANRIEQLTECSVYENLSLDMLAELEQGVCEWLEAVCSAFGVSRFTGEEMAIELANAITQDHPTATINVTSKATRKIQLFERARNSD